MALGDETAARGYLERLLAVWDAEMASGNQDYELHSRQMDGIREFAEDLLAGG